MNKKLDERIDGKGIEIGTVCRGLGLISPVLGACPVSSIVIEWEHSFQMRKLRPKG
jgi:hypothetical protein